MKLSYYTVYATKPGTSKPRMALAVTIAPSRKAAIERVRRLYTPTDPGIKDESLIAGDAYSDLSIGMIEATGITLQEAITECALTEAEAIARRAPRVKTRAPRASVQAVKQGRHKRSAAEIKATVDKLNRKTLKESASEYAASRHKLVNEGSRPAVFVDPDKAGKGPFKIKKTRSTKTRPLPVVKAPRAAEAPKPKRKAAVAKRVAKPKAKPAAKKKTSKRA